MVEPTLAQALLLVSKWEALPPRSQGENAVQTPLNNNSSAQILAQSLFKDLRGNGYSAHQVLGLTTELIDLVTQALREALAARQAELEVGRTPSAGTPCATQIEALAQPQ
jgi:hypothetical protein